jgi:hypothetical protein
MPGFLPAGDRALVGCIGVSTFAVRVQPRGRAIAEIDTPLNQAAPEG